MKLANLHPDELLAISSALKGLSASYSNYATKDEKEIDILKKMGFKVTRRMKSKLGGTWYYFTQKRG